MQKNNFKILCTRPLSDAIIEQALQNGIEISVASFIKTEPIISTELIDTIQSLATKKITAIFTSMNAVSTVTAQLQAIPDWNIYSLSGTTKDLIIDFFGEKKLVATARNASELSHRIIENENDLPIIFFSGSVRLDTLPQHLTQHNISFQEVVVYNTTQTPTQAEQSFDGILFFSPSAVHSFFSINKINETIVLFAIGDTTAATIESYTQNKIIISNSPVKEEMIEQVITYFSNY